MKKLFSYLFATLIFNTAIAGVLALLIPDIPFSYEFVYSQCIMPGTAGHDRRVRELALTASGAKLEAKLTGTQMKQLQAVFDKTGADAEAGWHRVMRILGKQG